MKTPEERIRGQAIGAFERMPESLQRDICEYLDENPSQILYSEEDIVSAWLVWNGIQGFTVSIVDLVLCVYGHGRGR